MKPLENADVLLIAPVFFGYDQSIAREIESLGARVRFLADRPFRSSLFRALTTKASAATQWYIDRLYARLLGEMSKTFSPAHVLVINGQTLSKRTLCEARRLFPSAKFTLYLWDSLDNRNSVVDNLNLFDRILTFDPRDATKYGLIFRPLFYVSELTPLADSQRCRYDLSFIGTCHSDRYAIIHRLLRSSSDKSRLYVYLFLQGRWVYWIYRLLKPEFRGTKPDDFAYVPLDKATLKSVFDQSAAVLDIEHPKQSGLTMRTIEAIGARKKLVTTNQNIRDYDFYGDNVHIVDRNNPSIPPGFLVSPFREYSSNIYAKYAIGGWLREVLDLPAPELRRHVDGPC